MLGLFNIFNIFGEKGIVQLVQRDRKPKEAVLFGILIYLKYLKGLCTSPQEMFRIYLLYAE